MNTKGLAERVFQQMAGWKAHTGNSATTDGLALMMSEKTRSALTADGYMTSGKMLFGLHTIATPDMPDGQIYFVVPDGHRFVQPLETNLYGAPKAPTMNWPTSGSYTFTVGGMTTPAVIYASTSSEPPSMGLYQQQQIPNANQAPTVKPEDIYQAVQNTNDNQITTLTNIKGAAGTSITFDEADLLKAKKKLDDKYHEMMAEDSPSITAKTWLTGDPDPLQFGEFELVADPNMPVGYPPVILSPKQSGKSSAYEGWVKGNQPEPPKKKKKKKD